MGNLHDYRIETYSHSDSITSKELGDLNDQRIQTHSDGMPLTVNESDDTRLSDHSTSHQQINVYCCNRSSTETYNKHKNKLHSISI